MTVRVTFTSLFQLGKGDYSFSYLYETYLVTYTGLKFRQVDVTDPARSNHVIHIIGKASDLEFNS